MPTVLICGPDRLMDDLRGTMIARDGIDRIHVHGFQQAIGMALAARPELVVVDRDLPMAGQLVENIREERVTRNSSIVVAARGELDPAELHLIEVGANALLRLPSGPDADGRLARLMEVPPRRAVRLPVRLRFDAFGLHGGANMPGLALNVSRHGMLVQCSSALAMGSVVQFGLELSADDTPVRGAARVLRDAGNDLYGLDFEEIEADGRQRLHRYVEG
jgi:hypothetical protein